MPKKASPDEKGRMIHVRLLDETHKILRMAVAEKDTTLQDWVEQLIVSKLKQYGKRKV